MSDRVEHEWRSRGDACRLRRLLGETYRSARDVALAAHLSPRQVFDMEWGRLDPAPLEAYWKTQPQPQVPA